MPGPSVHPIVNDEFGDTAVLVLGVYQTPVDNKDTLQREYSARDLEEYAIKFAT